MRKVSVREAVKNLTDQAVQAVAKHGQHPITGPLYLLFDIRVEMGSFHRTVRANSTRLKAHVNKLLQERKMGLRTSKMQGYDLMSVFLETPDKFSDELIVKNLIGVIFVGSETTQFAAQNVISHLAQSRDLMKKLRREVD